MISERIIGDLNTRKSFSVEDKLVYIETLKNLEERDLELTSFCLRHGVPLPRVRIYLLQAGFTNLYLDDEQVDSLMHAIINMLKAETGEDLGNDYQAWRVCVEQQ
jgi:hypothetical protein